MIDFYEKIYFAEIERKSKIQTALAFPIASSTVGIAAIQYAIENVDVENSCYGILLAPIAPAGIAFIVFLFKIGTFLTRGSYKYLWTMEQFKSHYQELVNFSTLYPDTPTPDETIKLHLINDLAACSTHNALVNDSRSEALHYANISVFVLVLFALLSAAMVVADKFF